MIAPHPALLPGWLGPDALIDAMGPWMILGVALIIFAECGILLGFFLPGDTLLFVSGLLIASSAGVPGAHLSLATFLPSAMVAAFAGNVVGYWIGRAVGPKVFRRRDARFLKPEYVERSHRFFERFGTVTVLLARFVPIVRTVATVMAGVGRMRLGLYLVYSAVGGVLWVAVVTVGGYYLGQIAFIRENVDLIFVVAAVVVVGFAVVPTAWHWYQRRVAGRAEV